MKYAVFIENTIQACLRLWAVELQIPSNLIYTPSEQVASQRT